MRGPRRLPAVVGSAARVRDRLSSSRPPHTFHRRSCGTLPGTPMASSSTPAGAAQSPQSPVRRTVFEEPLFTVGKGSAFYFPALPQQAHRGRSSPRADGGSGIGHPLSRPTKLVRGATRTFAVDVAEPPASMEEMLCWRLDRTLYAQMLPIHLCAMAREPLFLLPPHAMVTSLGPEMDAVDRVFRQKGFFTPSEVAQALFTVVPTFFTECSHVFKALPSNLVFRLESLVPRVQWIPVLLARYPMLFKLKRPKFQRSVVSLNSDFYFVRAHPLYGAGDRLMQKHNADYYAHAGGVLNRSVPTGRTPPVGALFIGGEGASDDGDSPAGLPLTSVPARDPTRSARQERRPLDMQIFDTLVRHLPRRSSVVNATERRGEGSGETQAADQPDPRYASLPLVQWVNSFSEAELDILNRVPVPHVLAVMQKYTHIFQLVCDSVSADGGDNVFVSSSRRALSRAGGLPAFTAAAPHEPATDLDTDIQPLLGEENDSLCGSNAAAAVRDGSRPPCVAAVKAAPSQTDTEKLMKEALQDDIVGLDDLFNDHLQERRGVPTTDAGAQHPSDHGPRAAGHQHSSSFHAGDIDGDAGSEVPPSLGAADTEPARTAAESLRYDAPALSEREGGVDGAAELALLDDAVAESSPDGAPQALDTLRVRRLPPDLAPRSLSDYDGSTSPEPHITRLVASLLRPPPSLADNPANYFTESYNAVRCSGEAAQPGNGLVSAPEKYANFGNAAGLWRWVPVDRVYQALTPMQRSYLRRHFKGFVPFLRLHGRLFELSDDFQHVIAHDPGGIIAPLVPSQLRFHVEDRVILPEAFDSDEEVSATVIGEDARRQFEEILGRSQLPTTRQQLVLLDPHNPLLHPEVFEDEVAELVPPKGSVSALKLMRSLPPLVRAVVPKSFALSSNRHLLTWTEKGEMMVQRRTSGVPTVLEQPVLKAEEAVESLRECIPIGGATVRALIRLHLPSATVRALEVHYGSVYKAVVAFPHYFLLREDASESRNDALVELRDQ